MKRGGDDGGSVPRIRVMCSDSFTTATVCHQCEDAPCANVCPVQATAVIGHIFVTPSRCIGCKSCMLAFARLRDDRGGVRVRRAGDKCDFAGIVKRGRRAWEACPTSVTVR